MSCLSSRQSSDTSLCPAGSPFAAFLTESPSLDRQTSTEECITPRALGIEKKTESQASPAKQLSTIVMAGAKVLSESPAMRLLRRNQPSPPPPMRVPLLLSDGGSIALTMSWEATLDDLINKGAEELNIPRKRMRVILEQGPTRGGSSFHALFHKLSSKERLKSEISDWLNFFLLPEAVGREVRGAGLAQWFVENVWLHVGGTVDDIAMEKEKVPILVHLWAGQRLKVRVSKYLTLTQVKVAVSAKTSVSAEAGRIILVERDAPSPFENLCTSLLKVVGLSLLYILVVFARPLVAFIRWQKHEMDHVTIGVQTAEGKDLSVRIRKDMTVGDVQAHVAKEFGEVMTLKGLNITGDD